MPLGESLRQASHRAHARATRRTGRRRGFSRQQAAIAASAGAAIPDFRGLAFSSRLWRWLIAVALIPFCVIATMTLFQSVSETRLVSNFLRSHSFRWFIAGFIFMSCWFWFFQKFASQHPVLAKIQSILLYFYVLGHEVTHALFVWCSAGWVSKIKVGTDGGYIVSNKSNILISLSPYFLPFWSVVLLGGMFLLRLCRPVPFFDSAMFAFLGVTWAFHLLWTLWMIPRDQPDLKENGTLYSIVIIYLANILILSAMVAWASAKLTARVFLDGWIANGETVFSAICNWVYP